MRRAGLSGSARLSGVPSLSGIKAGLLLAPMLMLTGCFVRVHPVQQTEMASHVQDATVSQLLQRTETGYDAIHTMMATVNITATTGGGRQGEEKEYPTFRGFMFLRKPADLRVLMQVPFVGSAALDMVSDGSTFKLMIPPRSKAVTGPDRMEVKDKGGLESLRPSIIRDSLLVQPVSPEDQVAMVQGTHPLALEKGQKIQIIEPTYDLLVQHRSTGAVVLPSRTIRFGRLSLDPLEQLFYDDQGRVATTVRYSDYQEINGLRFPHTIELARPLDEYRLRIQITKLTLNGKLDDESFVLRIPPNIPVQTMQ